MYNSIWYTYCHLTFQLNIIGIFYSDPLIFVAGDYVNIQLH